tara:strand:+ start:96 stop:347 length:252 start_codon:yes stop_codon:yes gene_type:complete
MYATFSETAKLLGYKTRATIYRLMSQGKLDDYLWNLEGKTYIYMGKRKGKTLARKIKSLVFDKNGFEVYDFDPQKDFELIKQL